MGGGGVVREQELGQTERQAGFVQGSIEPLPLPGLLAILPVYHVECTHVGKLESSDWQSKGVPAASGMFN